MPSTERLSGRNGAAYTMYLEGHTQEAIATALGISQQRVSQLIRDVRDSITPSVKEEQVQRFVDLLDVLMVESMQIVRQKPIPAYSAGKPIIVIDSDGHERVALDHSGRLAAMTNVLKIQERAAKLLGLDAATRLEHSINAQETEAVIALANAAADRLARRREGAA